jgi:hypothetical protein
MAIKYPIILSISLLCVSLTATAQSDTSFFLKVVGAFKQQPAQESVYLHLNKQAYSFGDTIWYKAYVVIGQHHQLSALSGVLYVELYSPAGSLVSRQLVQLHSGVGRGDIALPHSLKQGSYHLRAYTNWMRNFDNAFFNRQVLVGGIAPVRTVTGLQPDVQFFPEGGSLVAGARSRVAFKAVGPNGLGIAVKGTITDSKGDSVAIIETVHAGMGEFVLSPKPGETYTANMIAGSSRFTVQLPKAQEAGYILAVNNSLPDSIYLKVAVNDALLNKEKNTGFYLIAQSNGKVYYTSAGSLQQLSYTARIEKSRFPSGIVQFTLFSQSGGPVAERLAYIQGSDTLQLKADTRAIQTAGDKVELTINAKNNQNEPVTGSFSAAVINESLSPVDENAESTIMNNLLLTGQLKGYVEQPNYYFINPTEKTRADLDLLLLTQGYRRFEWKKILDTATVKPLPYAPEHSLSLSGKVTTPAGKPVAKATVTLVDAAADLLRDTVAGDSGRFAFDNLGLTDTALLVLRAKKPGSNANVRISVNQAAYPKPAPVTSAINTVQDTTVLQQQYKAYQKQQNDEIAGRGRLMKQVNIIAKVEKKPDMSHSANLHGGGNADQVIMGDQLGDCINLSDCLTGKVRFVNFGMGYATNHRGGTMSVIVDGAVFHSNHLNDIDVNNIYSIEVLRTAAARSIYGSSIEGGGALVITMKNGSEGFIATVAPLGLINIPFAGYTKTRIFYAPKYNPQNSTADESSAICWAPAIITDKNGKATISYHNNSKGTYRVVIEGIDDDGNLGRIVYRYKVE